MVEFETILSQDKKYARNNFIEVAKKKSEKGYEFVSVARGWFTPDGQKRYKKAFSLPFNKDVLGFAADVFAKLAESAPSDEEVKQKIDEALAKREEEKEKSEA